MNQDLKLKKVAFALQRGELTEALVYERLARRVKDEGNAQVLRQIAADENRHAAFWRAKSGREARASRLFSPTRRRSARMRPRTSGRYFPCSTKSGFSTSAPSSSG